jgi:hypothetical protein
MLRTLKMQQTQAETRCFRINSNTKFSLVGCIAECDRLVEIPVTDFFNTYQNT